MASPPIPPPPVPAKTVLWRTAETLAVAAVGGIALTYIGFPAGLITGSLLGVAVAGLAGRPMMIPVWLSRIISVLVGISLGAVVSPETLKGLVTFPLSVAVLAVSTLCMFAATTSYLRFVHGWDPQSALLGVDFRCEAVVFFTFEQDATAPGGFRIDVDVVLD